MILKSNRKFGVEIEFYAPSKTSYDAVVAKLPTERDGSLDGRQYGREYVSPVLFGKSGEQTLIKDCAVLNKHKCQSGDTRTSMHIHIDGRKFQNLVEETTSRDPKQTQIAISNKLHKDLGKDNAERIIRGDYVRIDEIKSSKIDNVTYLGYSARTTHPVLNYKYYNVYAHDDFKFMKNVFYFYTQYSDVMEMMVSNSRKKGNMYCIPLGECFDLAAIEDCRTMNDLENVWYKSTDRFDNYNNSRYHNVNLHCYFTESKGTVEIRSHGGTTDPEKILLWVRLHQHIIDKLDSIDFESVKPKTADLLESFLDFISDDPMLVEYVKRLVGYFSNVKI